MFSSRVPTDLQPNRVSQAVRRARDEGRVLLDLTLTNPTAAGIEYPPSTLSALSDAAALRYDPQPFGLESARIAVAADYARRGIPVDAGRIVLTASTSEAYSILFKLLCEPSGSRVLVPAPSYPLFEHLTRLDGVGCGVYRLDYHERWTLDAESVRQAWTAGTRAVLAVTPNNPTGSVLVAGELAALDDLCAARTAALIVDEVFADYPLAPAEAETPLHTAASACVTFRLGGLSKSAGLPQVKLGWIAVDGPAHLVAPALARLELICDTYLSVSTLVQVAAPALIYCGAAVRQQILDRVRGNYESLKRLAGAHPSVDVLAAEAGWSAVLRVPATMPEEELTLTLLERDGVLVHPGFFFDFEREAFLVVSLLPRPEIFREGVSRMLERVDG
jgi:alanine-synthesizing transaminase